FGGSTTSDVARDGVSGRSSQCREALIADGSSDENSLSGSGFWSLAICSSLASTFAAYSSSVSSARSPYCVGRSNGTPIELSLVYVPRRSGSPHGVRGASCATAASATVTSPSENQRAALM